MVFMWPVCGGGMDWPLRLGGDRMSTFTLRSSLLVVCLCVVMAGFRSCVIAAAARSCHPTVYLVVRLKNIE